MNKKVLIAAAVILLLLLGGWYFMSQKSPSTQQTGDSNATGSESSATSLKDLLTKGVAQTCTFSSDNGSGSVYVSGSLVRGDFDTTTDGKVTKSHMIVKDSTSYIWMDGQASGFKMAFDPNTVNNDSVNSPTVPNTGIDLAANNNYKCSTWVTDSSKFDLPSGVNFSSFDLPATAPKASGSAADSSSSSQCSYCNALSGDDKTQCLTALKCN